MTYLLVIFSISVLQFSFKLNAKYDGIDEVSDRSVSTIVKEAFFGTEIWSILLTLFTQDLPFCLIRTLIILKYGSRKNYLLYFFVSKNYLLIFFDIYMVLDLILNERHREKCLKKRKKLNTETKI
jgi:hypothetical protein